MDPGRAQAAIGGAGTRGLRGMARYDWPAGASSRDDPIARDRFVNRYLPRPDVRAARRFGSTASGAAGTVRSPAAPAADTQGGADGWHATCWLPIGPSTVVGGQASGRPRVAGRVRDVAVDPTGGDRIYAASASGGVWFSGDRGVSWRPLDEFIVSPNRDTLFPVGNALACGAIHVSFGGAADGSADDVFVGTGEPGSTDGTPGGKMAGVGILHAVGPATGTPWTVEVPALRGERVWRIVEDPLNRDQLFAATSDGLYARPPGGAWSRVAALGTAEVMDVLVTRTSAPDRVRIWVAQPGQVQVAEIAGPPAPPAGLDMTTVAFTAVTLAGFLASTRIVLGSSSANEVWVLGKQPRTGTQKFDPAHLERIDASVAVGALTGTVITGIPERLFMSASDQSLYDMAIAVHPETAGVVYLAGATTQIDGEFNGSVYRVTVAGTAGTAALVGKGVHADCHVVRVGPRVTSSSPVRSVWVGCDGGLFLSSNDGVADSFVPRNNSLAVLQPGFIANHPTNDGIVSAGLQDNGTVERVGDTVWREPFLGDGGGLVYDPANPNRYIRQYVQANWSSSDQSGVAPVFRRSASAPEGQNNSEKLESDAALFYAGAAALAHGGTTHLALGTNRVWYSPDWGQSWVTVPTGTDPRGGKNPDLAQDVLQPGAANGTYTDTVPTFLCCTSDYTGTAFQRVGDAGLLTCRLSARPDDGGNHRVRIVTLWNRGLAIFAGSRATASTGAWTWSTDVIETIRRPTAGAEQTAVDNGDPTAFLPAVGLVNDVNVHDAARGAHGSCYLATVGAAGSGAGKEIDTLWWYDGDGHFVPCGVRRDHPRGVWTGTRVTSPALAVVVDPDDPSTVYVGTSVAVVRGNLTMVDNAGTPEPHWAWTAFDNGLPEGAVHDLAIFRHGDLKLLRAALQSRGVWETDLQTAVQQPRTYVHVFPTDTRRLRPTPLTGAPTNGAVGVRWDASPDIVFDTSALVWPASGPDEADLFQLPFAGQVGEHAAQAFSNRTFRVHVLVHHRWFTPAAPASVRVALMRHDAPSDGSDIALGGIWATMVSIAGGGAVPASLPGGWVKAASQLVKPLTRRR